MKKLYFGIFFVGALIITLIYIFGFNRASGLVTKSEFKPQAQEEQTIKTEILNTDLNTNDEPKALNKTSAEDQDIYPPKSIDKSVLNLIDDIKRDREYFLKKDHEIISLIKFNLKNLKAVTGKKETFEYRNEKSRFKIRTYGKSSLIKDIRRIIFTDEKSIMYLASKNFLNTDSTNSDLFTERNVRFFWPNKPDDSGPIAKLDYNSLIIVNSSIDKIIVSYDNDNHDEQYIHDLSTGDTKLVRASSSNIEEEFKLNNYDSTGRLTK